MMTAWHQHQLYQTDESKKTTHRNAILVDLIIDSQTAQQGADSTTTTSSTIVSTEDSQVASLAKLVLFKIQGGRSGRESDL